MPSDLAAKWAEREAERVNKEGGLFELLPEKLSALMNHLLRENQVTEALALARSLLGILLDPRPERHKKAEEGYTLLPDPRARFSAWEFRRILIA